MKVFAHQGDTVDLLCQRHLGRTAGVVEQALRDNPGLAARGPVLPHGTPVVLTDATAAATAPQTDFIQLWD